jgi:hypothetical protein
LLGGLGSASAGALATLGQTGAAFAGGPTPADPTSAAGFDFDKGNFIRDVIAYFRPTRDDMAPPDVTILHRFIHYSAASWFDAIAPYHPTAVGVFSRLGRRPAGEAATNRNKNIAALHAEYQVIKGLDPQGRESDFRTLMTSIGLNPDDESEDRTSPVGIGNLAGKAAVAAAQRDGMNQLGDLGRRYNRQPYADYTGFRPVNTAYDLIDPSRWQPSPGPHNRRLAVGYGDLGAFTVQQFITPQMRLAKPHTYRDPGQFTLAPPRHSDATRKRDYKRSVDEVLSASAGLTDEQKASVEFFDDKRLGVGTSVGYAALAHPALDLDGWVHVQFSGSVAIFDALIAAWHWKTRYNAVRPWSAIQHVYGSKPVTAWGGPGVGTVHDIPATEWASYVKVGDHPEYPSGSTTLCSAEAQATRRFFNDDVLNVTYTVPAGSSVVEPHLTPAKDVVLHYDNWEQFIQSCGLARVQGGVHFLKTVQTSMVWGSQFGDLAYEYVQRYIKGKVD